MATGGEGRSAAKCARRCKLADHCGIDLDDDDDGIDYCDKDCGKCCKKEAGVECNKQCLLCCVARCREICPRHCI